MMNSPEYSTLHLRSRLMMQHHLEWMRQSLVPPAPCDGSAARRGMKHVVRHPASRKSRSCLIHSRWCCIIGLLRKCSVEYSGLFIMCAIMFEYARPCGHSRTKCEVKVVCAMGAEVAAMFQWTAAI